MASSDRPRRTYLHHNVTVEHPRLMSRQRLAEILEAYVRAVRSQAGSTRLRYHGRRSAGSHASIPLSGVEDRKSQ
jgi:hypothetical protein